MDTSELLVAAFGDLREFVPGLVEGLDEDALATRPDGRGNSVAWLVWHLARVQDDHLADAFGLQQLWASDGWQERLDLDLPADDTGYGHSPDEVAKVRASAEDLAGYHAAVADRTASLLQGTGPEDLDRVVDTSWDPPVTLGVRLLSVLGDTLQHAGQAAYVRGLLV